MKLFKLLLLLITFNMSAFATSGLTADESKSMDKFIQDIDEDKYKQTQLCKKKGDEK